MFAARGHDHGSCIEVALDRAETLCLARGVRLTDLRRQVLELVWRRHEPVGAYDLLDALKITHHNAAPPTIYRSLDFLIDQGLVHRLESLNAYIGCIHPDALHAGQFLICTGCASIGELDDPYIARAVADRAAALGFRVERQTIEVRGLCAECSRAAAPN
ncbi:MAG: Fur family transcriptional regulator, zinc uptake regulator [Bradyrhizobium sp.]|jgi:Fur family zinc uptake transcriptional regulator|nr:Fur family transcriptional regulator, zinc uptake regulator [Bradyrhizobium sp.]